MPDNNSNSSSEPLSPDKKDTGSASEGICTECGGDLYTDTQHGEKICKDCSLVIQQEEIDRGPEWRAYNAKEKEAKRRVGPATSNLLLNDGLSTRIPDQNKDGYGKPLSDSQQKRADTLRKWSSRDQSNEERVTKKGLDEIKRMRSQLDLPNSVAETASHFFQHAQQQEILAGVRSIEGVASACLYAASRRDGYPRTLDEVVPISRVEKRRIKLSYVELNRTLSLEVKPESPLVFIPRYVSELQCNTLVEQYSNAIIKLINNENPEYMSGRDPTGIAAAAIYFSTRITTSPKRPSQKEVAKKAQVSVTTLRKHREFIADIYNETGKEHLEEYLPS
jgi:transcription initiation factor TFIIB